MSPQLVDKGGTYRLSPQCFVIKNNVVVQILVVTVENPSINPRNKSENTILMYMTNNGMI